MRVLMIHTFHHPRGGDSTYTRSLTRLLEQRGHDVIPLAMRHPDNDPSPWEARFPPWVDMREVNTPLQGLLAGRRMMWSRPAARSCAALIDDVRPDVAHLQHVHRHLTPSVLDPLNAAGIPVVWTVHDYELICPAGHLFSQGEPCERCKDGDYRHAVRRRCKWGELLPSAAVALEKTMHRLRRVWWRVDRFLCPSQFLANKLVEFGVPAARVHALHNPLDLSEHRAGQGPGQGWLYAGRLADEKGVQVILRAAKMLPDRPLRICGDGPMARSLKQQARDLPWVRFLGHLPPEQLAEQIRSARVIAVPSRWYENFPYAVLEAQAAARAVVASRIGGIPEQITDGVDGRLVPPDDPRALARAVGELLDDPAQAQRLGQAGRARVGDTLRPADHVDAIVQLYQGLSEKTDR
ncbi:MAG: glycosyltransferase [Myxococcota bacterium]